MPKDGRSYLAERTFKYTVILTLLIEFVCLLLRYGFGLEATHDTASTIGALTFGTRIHHGYIGLLMLAVYPLTFRLSRNTRSWYLVLGLSLFLSDLIHHFAVLWPIEGSPHFDLVYPKTH